MKVTVTNSSDSKITRIKLRDRSNRLSLFLFIGTIIASVAWALVSRFVAPELIRSAYYGTSWPVFNGMIAHQAIPPLSYYLATVNTVSRYLLAALVFSGLFILLTVRPEVQDAFWGKDDDTVRDNAGASWRERLPALIGYRQMSVLALITLFALLLRMIDLGVKSFTEDEIASMIMARDRLPAFLWELTHGEGNMAAYYITLRFWILLGQSELALRSLSVLFALATVPAIYLLTASAFGRRAGLTAALLLGINGFHIAYSQDARSYTLWVFLVTLSSLSFLQGVRQSSRKNWFWYVAISVLATYVHIFTVLVLVSHFIFLLFLPRRIAPWRRFGPSAALIVFLALPMELLAIFSDKARHLDWVPKTTAIGVYGLFIKLAGVPIVGFGAGFLLLVYSIPIVSSILAFARSDENEERRQLTFFWTWLLIPIFLALLISIRQPVFVDRFLIICLPPLVVLASYGLARLQRGYAILLLLIISGLTAPGLIAYYKHPGQDWKGIAQYVASNQEPRDAIMIYPSRLESCVDYYLKSGHSSFSFVTPGPKDSHIYIPSEYDRVWFIRRESWPVDTAGENAVERNLIHDSLATGFHGIQRTKRFDGLMVTLFQK